MSTTTTTTNTETPKKVVTLEDGVRIARAFSAALWPVKHHVALGGSVLTKGESLKDVDIVVHPRNEKGVELNPELVLAALATIGYTPTYSNENDYGTERLIIIGTYQDTRVDLFFMA